MTNSEQYDLGSTQENPRPEVGGRKSPIGLYGVEDIPQIVGPYKILEILGRGGQATVYRAEDTRVRRSVALKVLHDMVGPASETLRRFRQEAEVTAKLDHPSICPIYEVGLDAVPFIAMKLVEGKTLAQHISTAKSAPVSNSSESSSFVDFSNADETVAKDGPRRMTPSTDTLRTPITISGTPLQRDQVFGILRVIEEVARALNVAHESGIVHRDIKPGNLMIQKDGTPMILDFGLAYQEDHAGPSLSHTGQILGTPAYMAPEQIAAKKMQVDRRADIYSLGVSLYECLTLKRPFESPSREALYQAITFKDPVEPRRLNPAISSDVQVVVLKALEKDPDVRFQTALDFAEELRRIRGFEPITTRPVSLLTRHLRWVQRNPGWAVAVYGIFVALSLAVGVFYFKNAELDRTNTELKNERQALKTKTAEAERESAAKGVALLEYDRLADSTLFAQAKAEAGDLFPVSPGLVAKIESWLSTYTPLFERLALHEATLAAMRKGAAPYTEVMRARDYADEVAKMTSLESAATEALEKAKASPNNDDLAVAARDAEDAAKAARSTYLSRPQRSADFGEDKKTQFKHDVLAKLVLEMGVFLEPKSGDWADVQKRLQRSREVRKKTVDDHETAWKAAIARIAANPKYMGLKLQEQVGLIPLGPDKDSELEEFYEIETGAPPARDGQGKIIVTENMAMVFVLIPGGTFWMGSQNKDEAGRNYDPAIHNDDGPVHEVTLSAYFLSKYEMTQGQWVRTSKGDHPNPSHWVKENWAKYDFGREFDLRLPVDSASWDDCRDRLRRLGCVLPTEAQWEFACRAGKETKWSFGDDLTLLEKFGNVADQSYRVFSGQHDTRIDDKYAAVSAVGSFLANGFGMHDMHGNLLEWCEDVYSLYGEARHREGDGLQETSGGIVRVARGGSFRNLPPQSRSAFRSGNVPSVSNVIMGVRAARRITSD